MVLHVHEGHRASNLPSVGQLGIRRGHGGVYVWLAYRRQGNQCRRVARSAASAQTKTGERDDQGRRRDAGGRSLLVADDAVEQTLLEELESLQDTDGRAP